MVSLSFASLSREAGLVVVTLGYGVNWAVFLSSQPELGDHRADVSAEPDECLYRLSVYAHDRKLLVWVDTPGRTAGHWVAAGVLGMAGTWRTLGGAKCVEP